MLSHLIVWNFSYIYLMKEHTIGLEIVTDWSMISSDLHQGSSAKEAASRGGGAEETVGAGGGILKRTGKWSWSEAVCLNPACLPHTKSWPLHTVAVSHKDCNIWLKLHIFIFLIFIDSCGQKCEWWNNCLRMQKWEKFSTSFFITILLCVFFYFHFLSFLHWPRLFPWWPYCTIPRCFKLPTLLLLNCAVVNQSEPYTTHPLPFHVFIFLL